MTEEVEVKGEATILQTERADISSVVERKRIEDLPLVSRNPLALTALQPGVTGIPTRNDFLQPEQGLGISASGMRGGANSAYIDGMSINANPHAGTVLIVPNVEAVQEFQVITNNPSAEHGRNIGASVNMVTRRGTNQFSGSAFQFYRNEALRAKNVFETEEAGVQAKQFRLQHRRSRACAIARSSSGRTKAYANRRRAAQLYVVETEQFRDFVLQTRPNTIAAQLLRDFHPRAYPTTGLRDLGSPAPGANVIGPPDGIPDVGTLSFAIPSPRDGDQFNGRFDQMFRGGNDQLRATYYLSNISTWFNDVRDAVRSSVSASPAALHGRAFARALRTARSTSSRSAMSGCTARRPIPRHRCRPSRSPDSMRRPGSASSTGSRLDSRRTTSKSRTR